MTNEQLKSQIFATNPNELKEDGATPGNTEVIELDAVPDLPGPVIRLLRKTGQKFVTLVGKWGGCGFLIYVSFVQAVPKHTPLYAPNDENSLEFFANHDPASIDLHNIELSGSAELWIEIFGIDQNQRTIDLEIPLQLQPGDRIHYVPANWESPSCLSPTLSGDFENT